MNQVKLAEIVKGVRAVWERVKRFLSETERRKGESYQSQNFKGKLLSVRTNFVVRRDKFTQV